MNNVWSKQGNDYYLGEISNQEATLENAIYKVMQTPHGMLYLSRTQDKFSFPYKVYGVETDFINRVVKTYKNTKSNLGIIFNGIKGTGKTVTAEMICNELKMPVLIISLAFPGINNFINDIQQDIILFIDEFEKVYNEQDHSVLSIMDGALNNQYRKIFLLTTNNLYVNENLVERPGRVRYVKKFEGLSLKYITEIVDDKLVYKELKKEVIEFIATLQIITIDNVKAIIDEVNIHNEVPKKFADIFNVKQAVRKSNVIWNDGKKDIIVWKEQNISPKVFIEGNEDETSEGSELVVNGTCVGFIKSVIDKETATIEIYDRYKTAFKPSTRGKKPPTGDVIIKIENIESYHRYFERYAW